MKPKNLLFALLGLWSIIGVNTAHAGQASRFARFGRYVTAVATRCNQAFKTAKQSKPVTWVQDHQIGITATAIGLGAGGLLINEAFKRSSFAEPPQANGEIIISPEIRTRIKNLATEGGIPTIDPKLFKSREAQLKFLENLEKVEKYGQAKTPLNLALFFRYELKHFSTTDQHSIAYACLKSCFDSLDFDTGTVFIGALVTEEDQLNFMTKLLERDSEPKYLDLTYFANDFTTSFSHLPWEKTLPALVGFLEKNFGTLNLKIVVFFISKLEFAGLKERYAKRALEEYSATIIMDDYHYGTVSTILDFIHPDDRLACVERLIEKSLRDYDNRYGGFGRLIDAIRMLPSTDDRLRLLEQLIRQKALNTSVAESVLKSVDPGQRPILASLYIKTSFSDRLLGNEKTFLYLIQELSSDEEKINALKFFLHHADFTKGRYELDRNHWDEFIKTLESFSEDHRSEAIKLVLKIRSKNLADFDKATLISKLPKDQGKQWATELVNENELLSVFVDETVQGPLFSQYNLIHAADILHGLQGGFYFGNRIEKKGKGMYQKIASFTKQEYQKGNIVLFHGQHDQWKFLEKCFDKLLQIQGYPPAPENFIRFRFSLKTLPENVVREIRQQGVTKEMYPHHRFNVIFANLNLLANDTGSNSLMYTLANYDQTLLHKRIDFDDGIRNQFEELGMQEEFKQLQKEEPAIFNRLYELYKKEVTARGDVGRLIAISLPRHKAKELVYPAQAGADLFPLLINDKQITDVCEISDLYDGIGFSNEFCIILSKEMTLQKEASHVGIQMAEFSAEHTEESKKYAEEFEREFEKVMNRIAELYVKRKIRIANIQKTLEALQQA